MPYITREKRGDIGMTVFRQGAGIGLRSVEGPGDLNYMLTYLIHQYYTRAGGNYPAANDVLGALEGAKLEFYRRIVAPYEDRKMEENGDVYYDAG
jgi:hypothetical protein